MASVSCPACRVVLQLPADCAASAVRCPRCKGVIPLAGATETAPAKEPPEGPAADVIPVPARLAPKPFGFLRGWPASPSAAPAAGSGRGARRYRDAPRRTAGSPQRRANGEAGEGPRPPR